MQASKEDLACMLKIQQINIDEAKLSKQFDELPQRQTILDARQKRDTLKAKRAQVDALKKEASKRLSRINDEDESLTKKQNGVQAAIEAANGDFRNVEARSKELDGISRRRGALADERADIEEELHKITAIRTQLALAAEEVDKMEANATESFQSEGGDLKKRMARLGTQREKLLASLDPELAKVYKHTVDICGGIAVGELKDSRCGVCRSTIDGGRLIELRAQAPLGKCPACKRLLIIS